MISVQEKWTLCRLRVKEERPAAGEQRQGEQTWLSSQRVCRMSPSVCRVGMGSSKGQVTSGYECPV